MANLLKPARATSPGRVLLRELDARGWSQRDLAAIMGRPYQAINQIVRGVKRITPETARELAQAFGTSPELWINLEVNYRLQLAKQEKKEREIARRSHLYSLAPVAELIRRGQIEGSDDVDELEKQVREYLSRRKRTYPLLYHGIHNIILNLVGERCILISVMLCIEILTIQVSATPQ